MLVLVVIFGSLFVIFKSNMEQQRAEVLAQRETVRSAGARTGERTDERGCFVDAVERYKALSSHSITAQVLTAMQTTSCLKASQPTKDFCKSVPPPSPIVELVQWNLQTCTNLGMAQEHDCMNMIKPIAQYCASADKAKKASANPETAS